MTLRLTYFSDDSLPERVKPPPGVMAAAAVTAPAPPPAGQAAGPSRQQPQPPPVPTISGAEADERFQDWNRRLLQVRET